ncbi:MAG: ExeA family protein [Candidatus Omnitrophica bacterium]|nr:ExeA family protein [Candidatus Omnitrophota bacterium]
MSFYRLLGLEREPFSTSPDPAFFYQSPGHQSALFRLAVNIRLKRGISLLLGDVGTGKTTLSRRLYQLFGTQSPVVFHILLNPFYASEKEFLHILLDCFHLRSGMEPLPNVSRSLERIKSDLFDRAVNRRETVVLLIDEAQKLTDESLEILRILLNYETNEVKLLQVVLLGQMELSPRMQGIRNLWDRISFKQSLLPFDEAQTGEMIRFRLQAAGYRGRQELFTEEAIREIYQQTQGYPRRIAMLAHEALEFLVMFDLKRADQGVILELVERNRCVTPLKVTA